VADISASSSGIYVRMCVCVVVYVCVRERERESVCAWESAYGGVCVRVCDGIFFCQRSWWCVRVCKNKMQFIFFCVWFFLGGQQERVEVHKSLLEATRDIDMSPTAPPSSDYAGMYMCIYIHTRQKRPTYVYMKILFTYTYTHAHPLSRSFCLFSPLWPSCIYSRARPRTHTNLSLKRPVALICPPLPPNHLTGIYMCILLFLSLSLVHTRTQKFQLEITGRWGNWHVAHRPSLIQSCRNICVYLNSYTSTCVCIHMYLQFQMHMRVCMCIQIHVCIYNSECICMCVYVHAYLWLYDPWRWHVPTRDVNMSRTAPPSSDYAGMYIKYMWIHMHIHFTYLYVYGSWYKCKYM